MTITTFAGRGGCAYHFHRGDEEWLVVVAGPHAARPGDPRRRRRRVLPRRAGRAHRVHVASESDARVALFSNKREFGIIEYPDSDEIGVWGRHAEALDHVIRRSPDLDYWDGERS